MLPELPAGGREAPPSDWFTTRRNDRIDTTRVAFMMENFTVNAFWTSKNYFYRLKFKLTTRIEIVERKKNNFEMVVTRNQY